MKLRLLRSVATVASHGSLLKASQILGLSQPALTKNLREIEDIVGVRLFDRHARGVHPNAYGVLLADAARKILDILTELDNGFDRMDCQVGGSVMIGALPTAAAGVVPELMQQLRISDPGIALRVSEDRASELCSGLVLGDLDLVVGRLYSNFEESGQFECLPLYDEPLAFVVGAHHPLAKKEQVVAEDLQPFDISLPVPSLRIRADVQAFLNCHGVQCRDELTTTSMMLQRELLFSSNMISVFPWLMLRGDIDRQFLKILPLISDKKPPARPAGLLYRKDRPLPTAATRVINVLKEYSQRALPQYH